MPARHSPEPPKCQRGCKIANVDAAVTITFTGKREHRIGPRIHPAADAAGEVHSKKRKLRVRHGIDQCAHQGGALGYKIVILAAEGHDPYAWLVSGHAADSVAVEAGAVDEQVRRKRAASSFDYDLIR